MLLLFLFIMHTWKISKFVSRLLSCEISLRVGQHLVANHELLDSGRPEEGRIVDGMELPVTVVSGVLVRAGRSAMETHRVGETALK